MNSCETLINAAISLIDENYTICQASKEFDIPLTLMCDYVLGIKSMPIDLVLRVLDSLATSIVVFRHY